MAYRKNAKPDVEEVPVREPIRWHRWSIVAYFAALWVGALCADFAQTSCLRMGSWTTAMVVVTYIAAALGVVIWNVARSDKPGGW